MDLVFQATSNFKIQYEKDKNESAVSSMEVVHSSGLLLTAARMYWNLNWKSGILWMAFTFFFPFKLWSSNLKLSIGTIWVLFTFPYWIHLFCYSKLKHCFHWRSCYWFSLWFSLSFSLFYTGHVYCGAFT